MIKKLVNTIVLVSLLMMIAQTNVCAEEEGTLWDESAGDAATVAGMGFGGAILGLSTLSFVEEPKDHLKNILVGGSIGIIVGVGVVAWSQATKSKGLYEDNASLSPDKLFNTVRRMAWHEKLRTESFQKMIKVIPQFAYRFTF